MSYWDRFKKPKKDQPDSEPAEGGGSPLELAADPFDLMRSPVCCREGCGKAPSWTPQVFVRPVGRPEGQEAMIETGMTFCDECRKDAPIASFFSYRVNPQGNIAVKAMFIACGKAEPDLENVRVQWREL